MRRKLSTRLLLISTLIFLVQCSPGGFSPVTSPVADTVKSGSGSTISDEQATADRKKELEQIIANADMSSTVNAPISGPKDVRVIDFDRANGNYIVRVPMSNFGTVMALDMSVIKYPDIRLRLEYIGSWPYITVTIPVKYVLRNVTKVKATLPNGDRVPLFPAGEPPSEAILLTPNRTHKVYLYLSAEAFGIYAETSFNPLPAIGGISLNQYTYTIKNGENNAKPALGYLTYVAKKGDYFGGFFLSLKIDPKLGKILDEYYLN